MRWDWSKSGAWFSVAAALISGVVWIYSTFVPRHTFVEGIDLGAYDSRSSAEIEKKINSMDMKVADALKKLDERTAAISNVSKEDSVYIVLQKLHADLDEVRSREQKIESVILTSPDKALELPLLRRDLNNIKESQQAAIISLKDSVDRVYDLNKWLMGAMAVSIVTLAVGNLLKPKENNKPE